MVWFDARAIRQWHKYHRLSAHAPAYITALRVEEQKKDRYTVIARYFFDTQERSYEGVSAVAPPYKNPWAAEQAQRAAEQRAWQAWFNPRYPEESTLYKEFPMQAVLSAAVLTGLVFYFFALGLFVGGQRGNRTH